MTCLVLRHLIKYIMQKYDFVITDFVRQTVSLCLYFIRQYSTIVMHYYSPPSLSMILSQDGTQKSQKVFVNIPTEVGATEPEEIGAHLTLR